MSRLHRFALAAVSIALTTACQQNGASPNLPEPVGETQPQASAARPGESLPSSHARINPAGGPGDQAVNRPLPPGTRNPMEDIVAFKARLEKNPKDLEALISLGNANMMISRYDAAQDLYRRALEINPKDLDVRTNLAIAYKYGGKPDQAFTELEKNLAIDPNNDPTLYNLGFLYLYDRQDKTKAIEIWKKWLALYPSAPAAPDVSKQIAQIEAGMAKGTAAPNPGS
jgi:tetratricopeptide (TPR) repeat protein